MNQKKKFKLFDSKIFWIIVSVVLSIIMWAYVSDTEGKVITRTFTGIQLEFSGEEELLEQRSLSITNVDTQSVTLTIRGSRSNIGGLKSSDIKAVIDVKDIKQPNDMSWAYDIVFPSNTDTSDIAILAKTPETINFTVVKNGIKTVPVKGSFEGEIAEGCVAQELVFEPGTITIEGPEKMLESIDHAFVSFGEGKIESTYSENTGFVLQDKNGKTVSNTGLKLSQTTVTATQPILKTKELPLKISLIAGGGITAADCTVTIEPASISVAADSRLIDDMNSLVIGTVDLASFQSSFEDTFTIALDDNIQNITGITEAKVKIEIPGTFTKTFTTSNIAVKNVSTGYVANIDTREIEVTLRSKDADALARISADDITVVADLTDYGTTTGQIIVNGKVTVGHNDMVGAIGEARVTLTLVKA